MNTYDLYQTASSICRHWGQSDFLQTNDDDTETHRWESITILSEGTLKMTDLSLRIHI